MRHPPRIQQAATQNYRTAARRRRAAQPPIALTQNESKDNAFAPHSCQIMVGSIVGGATQVQLRWRAQWTTAAPAAAECRSHRCHHSRDHHHCHRPQRRLGRHRWLPPTPPLLAAGSTACCRRRHRCGSAATAAGRHRGGSASTAADGAQPTRLCSHRWWPPPHRLRCNQE